ncbi:hypothetical protein ABD72_05590 [Brevibacillus laterosporus]|nr:hypothetical protein [Brevibacillus laterosporus]TPH10696.1 hypothetical protein EGH09_19885 [Brevibacillus laterosporus]
MYGEPLAYINIKWFRIRILAKGYAMIKLHLKRINRGSQFMRSSSMLFFPNTIAPYTGARIETINLHSPIP